MDISHRHECAEVPLAGMTAARYFGMCTCSFMYSQNPPVAKRYPGMVGHGFGERNVSLWNEALRRCSIRNCNRIRFRGKYIMGEYCTFSYRLLQEPPNDTRTAALALIHPLYQVLLGNQAEEREGINQHPSTEHAPGLCPFKLKAQNKHLRCTIRP